jgi:hypothetical protein
MRWQKWDPTNAAQRADAEKIHDSYPIMQQMVVLVYKEPEGKSTTFKRWFGPEDADNVKKVLGRVVHVITEWARDRITDERPGAPPGRLCKTRIVC